MRARRSAGISAVDDADDGADEDTYADDDAVEDDDTDADTDALVASDCRHSTSDDILVASETTPPDTAVWLLLPLPDSLPMLPLLPLLLPLPLPLLPLPLPYPLPLPLPPLVLPLLLPLEPRSLPLLFRIICSAAASGNTLASTSTPACDKSCKETDTQRAKRSSARQMRREPCLGSPARGEGGMGMGSGGMEIHVNEGKRSGLR